MLETGCDVAQLSEGLEDFPGTVSTESLFEGREWVAAQKTSKLNGGFIKPPVA